MCGFSSAFGSAFYTLFNPQIRSPQIRILPVTLKQRLIVVVYDVTDIGLRLLQQAPIVNYINTKRLPGSKGRLRYQVTDDIK